MQNNNFAETLASVASEFGVEDTAKHGRGIKPSKRPYFRWTDEQLEQLATLRDEGKSANEIAEALGVSRDKVITKLAAMAARQRAKPEAVREQIKQAEQELSTEPVPEAEAEPEQEAETEPSIEAEPEPELNPVSQDLNPTDVDIDRMIFTAFDNVVGKVDDFVTMSGCWRKVLTTIEK
ncbi:MAG: GcrA family cell cycle regulator [Agathobaculum sp.]